MNVYAITLYPDPWAGAFAGTNCRSVKRTYARSKSAAMREARKVYARDSIKSIVRLCTLREERARLKANAEDAKGYPSARAIWAEYDRASALLAS